VVEVTYCLIGATVGGGGHLLPYRSHCWWWRRLTALSEPLLVEEVTYCLIGATVGGGGDLLSYRSHCWSRM